MVTVLTVTVIEPQSKRVSLRGSELEPGQKSASASMLRNAADTRNFAHLDKVVLCLEP